MRYENMILVDGKSNFNRFFEMEEIQGGKFVTRTGRVESRPVERTYSIDKWDLVLKNHLDKGFVRRGIVKKSEKRSRFKTIPDRAVEELFNAFMKATTMTIEKSYSVSIEEVSPLMLKEAQAAITMLTRTDDLCDANDLLIRLFQIIPRKIRDVEAEFIQDKSLLGDRVKYEQDLLDALKAGISMKQAPDPEKTILDEFGLRCRPFTREEEQQTIRHLGKSGGLYRRGFRLNNLKNDQKYDAYKQEHQTKDHFLYHGSKTMNMLGIVTQGLLLNPNAPITGKMFGQGIYFANDPDKSIGYTDLMGSRWAHGMSNHAYLMVFKVQYKNPFHCDRAMSHLNSRSIRPYDACFAHKGNQLLRDEIIVYNEAQCTPYGILEIER